MIFSTEPVDCVVLEAILLSRLARIQCIDAIFNEFRKESQVHKLLPRFFAVFSDIKGWYAACLQM